MFAGGIGDAHEVVVYVARAGMFQNAIAFPNTSFDTDHHAFVAMPAREKLGACV